MPDLDLARASFGSKLVNGSTIAPESIVGSLETGFQAGLRRRRRFRSPSLRGTSVSIEDRFGVSRDALALLRLAEPDKSGSLRRAAAPGRAVITVKNSTAMGGSNANHRATVLIDQAAPSIFSANADGFWSPGRLLFNGCGVTEQRAFEPAVRRNSLWPV
jgi:hypothetical protein